MLLVSAVMRSTLTPGPSEISYCVTVGPREKPVTRASTPNCSKTPVMAATTRSFASSAPSASPAPARPRRKAIRRLRRLTVVVVAQGGDAREDAVVEDDLAAVLADAGVGARGLLRVRDHGRIDDLGRRVRQRRDRRNSGRHRDGLLEAAVAAGVQQRRQVVRAEVAVDVLLTAGLVAAPPRQLLVRGIRRLAEGDRRRVRRRRVGALGAEHPRVQVAEAAPDAVRRGLGEDEDAQQRQRAQE
jgi:hypothetical protein